MSLAVTQVEFSSCVGQLLRFIDTATVESNPAVTFGVSLGDAYRDPRLHGAFGESQGGSYSSRRSCHKLRLAIDLNLFMMEDGAMTFCRKSSDHLVFGTYWKTLHPLARWGGDFRRPDGNHYSFTQWGVS